MAHLTSFKPLLLLLSGYTKNSNGVHYVKRPVSVADQERVLQHAATIKKFTLSSSNTSACAIPMSTYLVLMGLRPAQQAFFPNLTHLSIEDIAPSTSILPFFHSTPTLQSIHVGNVSRNWQAELLCFLETLSWEENSNVTELSFGPAIYSFRAVEVLCRFANVQYASLRDICPDLEVADLKMLGQLPHLLSLTIAVSSTDFSPPQSPLGSKSGSKSFPHLRKITIEGRYGLITQLLSMISSTSVIELSATWFLMIATQQATSQSGTSLSWPFRQARAHVLAALYTFLAHQNVIQSILLGVIEPNRLEFLLPSAESINLVKIPTLQSLTINGWVTDKPLWIREIPFLGGPHAVSNLTTLHLPMLQRSDCPHIGVADILTFTHLPNLRSLRCMTDRIDDRVVAALEPLSSKALSESTSHHELTSLSIGTLVGPNPGEQLLNESLLALADFIFSIFPLVTVVAHEGLGEGVWGFVAKMVQLLQRKAGAYGRLGSKMGGGLGGDGAGALDRVTHDSMQDPDATADGRG